MFDCVKKGLCGLFRNKLRSFLTIGGIAIGVISVMVISSIGQIGQSTIDSQLNNMGMDSLVVSADKNNISGLNIHDLAIIKEIKSVENAMPLMNFYTQSKIRDNSSPCMLWGVNEDADSIIELIPIHGRLLNKGDIVSGDNVCIVDEQIALKNYKRSNIVGKSIEVSVGGQLEKFEVVGVVKNGVNLLQNMLGEIIPEFVYIPYTTLQKASSQYFFDQIAVKVSVNANSEEATEQIKQIVTTERTVPTKLSVDNLLKQKSQLNNIMEVITMVLSAIAGISLVVSGLSIMTVMLVSVNERTREIGIKKSIGATNGNILMEFLLEAVLITLVGGIIGSIAGVGISVIGCLILGLAIQINFGLIFGIIGFTVAIGLLFGVYPALSAARLRPVDALRRE